MKKIEDIVKQMTFEEKAQLLTGINDARTRSYKQYGIESKTMIDGPHGVRIDREKNCTHFPNLCALAASWDVEMAKKMGAALAQECKKNNIDMLLAPGINIKRTPLCGRNFEYISEDPVVAGEMGAAYINGLQNNGVACSLKHFAANNQEKYRCVTSVEIDERTLREIYLKPFEIAVKKAKPESIMCSYNKINAIWSSENPFLLTEILRNEWKYDGFVVSDWGAVHDVVKAVRAGLDLQMPSNNNIVEQLKSGIENGDISMENIDFAVKNILKFALREKVVNTEYDRDKQHEIAKEIASSGIVLLKNDNNVLPLTEEKYKKIAVIGDFAENPLVMGQGSSEVYPMKEYVDSPLAELKKLLPNTEITYKEVFKRSEYSENMIWPEFCRADFVHFISEADVVIVFAGSMTSEDSEMFDRCSIELNPNYERVVEVALEHGRQVILVLQTGSAVMLERLKNTSSAIVQMWLSGEAGGAAIAEILCGKKNPSGKLPETFPTKLRTDINYPGNGKFVEYNEKLNVGYRYYDKHTEEICYPFGHGLSYTDFSYNNLSITETDEEFNVCFNLKNTGRHDGAEIIQVYVSDPVSTVPKPLKELKHFEKVFLNSGEEKEITVKLNRNDFTYYNTALHSWVVENGTYKIMIGSSSQDIRLEDNIIYNQKMPYSIQQVGDAMVGDTNVCFGL